ncbi:TPA: hypothetical protein EYN65_14790 [Candidatus Poribacteria bacterium]|nr:hypothetical protein [Candidatus Poribacteria bacterium]
MKKLKLFLILFFGYAILTIIMTYPVVFRFSSHFMCDGGDGFQNVWNMWWMKKSLMAGTHPYYTNLLHYPAGITLLFQTLNPFNGLISIPFQICDVWRINVLLGRLSAGSKIAGICSWNCFHFLSVSFRAWTWSLAINCNGVDSTICIVSAENVSRR